MEFSADIKLIDALPAPALRHLDLIDTIAVGQIDIIGNTVRAEPDRCPIAQFPLGKDYIGGPVAQQELFLTMACSPGNDLFRAELIQREGRLQRTEEIIADGDNTEIVKMDPECVHKGLISAVSNPRV